MKFEIKECENLKYVIRYPKGYKTGEKYPVILFLHGAGGRETGIETKLDHSFLPERHNTKIFRSYALCRGAA